MMQCNFCSSYSSFLVGEVVIWILLLFVVYCKLLRLCTRIKFCYGSNNHYMYNKFLNDILIREYSKNFPSSLVFLRFTNLKHTLYLLLIMLFNFCWMAKSTRCRGFYVLYRHYYVNIHNLFIKIQNKHNIIL